MNEVFLSGGLLDLSGNPTLTWATWEDIKQRQKEVIIEQETKKSSSLDGQNKKGRQAAMESALSGREGRTEETLSEGTGKEGECLKK